MTRRPITTLSRRRCAGRSPTPGPLIDTVTSIGHVTWKPVMPAARARCTTEKFKRFKRWKHEAVLEAMQRWLDAMPDAMAVRRATVEHVFGTLKAWMVARPLPDEGLERSAN